jgi:hypothetical protein
MNTTGRMIKVKQVNYWDPLGEYTAAGHFSA